MTLKSESGIKRSKQFADGFPPRYEPTHQPATLFTRCVWSLSKLGRVRAKLLVAIQNPTSAEDRSRLAHVLLKLKPSLVRNDATVLGAYREGLLFLAWSAINRNAFEEAETHLAELDAKFMDSLDRLALRVACLASAGRIRGLDIGVVRSSAATKPAPAGSTFAGAPVDRIQQQPERAVYLRQMRRLLQDPLAIQYAPLVQHAVEGVYQWMTVEERCELAAVIVPDLALEPYVHAAVELWKCPEHFGSISEARNWADRITPDQLHFSGLMCADAWLVRAEIAEWNSDFAAMESAARSALAIVPNSSPASICHIRSALYRPDGLSPSDEVLDRLPISDESAIVRMLCVLRRGPSLDGAALLVTKLSESGASLRPLELRLALRLLEPVMTSVASRQPQNIRACAAVSRQFQQVAPALTPKLAFRSCYCPQCGKTTELAVGAVELSRGCAKCGAALPPPALGSPAAIFPWSEINQALEEFLADRKYRDTYVRLEAPDIAGNFHARWLAQVARLLAGSPVDIGDIKPVGEVALISAALYSVLVKPTSLDQLATWGNRLAQFQGHPILTQIPALVPCRDVLMLAIGHLTDNSSREDILNYRLSSDAPAWAAWMLSRLRLMVCDPAHVTSALKDIPVHVLPPMQTNDLLFWWKWHYGRDDYTFSPDTAAADFLATDLQITELRKSTNFGNLWMERYQIAQVWKRNNPSREIHKNQNKEWSDKGEEVGLRRLGEVGESTFQFDTELDMRIRESRSALRKQAPTDLVSKWEILRGRLTELGPLLAAWWRPIIEYWRGVTLASAGSPEAISILRHSMAGPMGFKARAQLAILYVKLHDLAGADQTIAGIEEAAPSVSYAKALIAERRGDRATALKLLESVAKNGSATKSPYLLAARRLSAAIAERQSDSASAQREYRDILRSYPGDPVTSARLGRSVLRQAWFSNGGEMGEVAALSKDALEHPATPVPWAAPFVGMARLWTGTEEDPNSLAANLKRNAAPADRTAAAWNQLSIRCLLAKDHADLALEVLDFQRNQDGHELKVAQLVLQAWSLLVKLWYQYRPPSNDAITAEARWVWLEHERQPDRDEQNWAIALDRVEKAARSACVDRLILTEIEKLHAQMQAIDGEHRTPVLVRWRTVLQLAMHIARNEQPPVTEPDWQQLGDWSFINIACLWTQCEARNAKAHAEAVAKLLQQPLGHSPDQITVLRAVVNWSLGHDDQFVDNYYTLEKHMSALAIDPIQLWLATATIWHRRKNWKSLLESDLPECVADLSHPAARFVVGISYAHVALEAMQRNDTRLAQQRVRQALDNLDGVKESQFATALATEADNASR